MDLIIFERKAFEEFATKIEQFILRVSNSPVPTICPKMWRAL